MALNKQDVSLITVAGAGVAPGGFYNDLTGLTQLELANVLANEGLLPSGSDATFALTVAANLGSANALDLITHLQDGLSRPEALVKFANKELVAQNGKIATVDAAAKSTSTSKDLNALKSIVAGEKASADKLVFETQIDNGFTNGQLINNVGKEAIENGQDARSSDYTFVIKDQANVSKADLGYNTNSSVGGYGVNGSSIGSNASSSNNNGTSGGLDSEIGRFTGQFLSPLLDPQAAKNSDSSIIIEMLDGFAERDGFDPLTRLNTDGFAFNLDETYLEIRSEGIYKAKTYEALRDAIEAEIKVQAADNPRLDALEVVIGPVFNKTNQDGDPVSGTTVIIRDTEGAVLEPLGFGTTNQVHPFTDFNAINRLDKSLPVADDAFISTNLEATNVGYGSQGGVVNLTGQSASGKGIEQLQVTAKDGVWFTRLESRDMANQQHLEEINLLEGSNGYFNVGTQGASLVNQNFEAKKGGGLVDVLRVDAKAADSAAINAFISENVIARDYDLTGANQKATNIAYDLTGGNDVLNLSINKHVLAATDTKVVINTGSGNDVVHFQVNDGLNSDGTIKAVGGGHWQSNQKLLNNVEIKAGSGNDQIVLTGAGNVTVSTGAGNDEVRADNSGTGAVFLFNNTSNDIDKLLNTDNTLSETISQSAYSVYNLTLQVDFLGIKSGWIKVDSKNFTTTTLDVNQAIKKAILDSNELSKLLVAHDNAGKALGIESLVDGFMSAEDLTISFQEPAIYNPTETAAEKAAREFNGQLMQDKVGLKDVNGDLVAFDALNEFSALKGNYTTTELANGYTGSISTVKSNNQVNVGSGNDLFMMGTGVNSVDTLVLTGYNQGKTTLVHFDAAQDSVNTSSYRAKETVTANFDGRLDTDGKTSGTSVKDVFEKLTANQLQDLLNAEADKLAAAEKGVGELGSLSTSISYDNAKNANNKYILRVDNANKDGLAKDYKLFEVTVNSSDKYSAQEITHIQIAQPSNGEPTKDTPPTIIATAPDVYTAVGTDEADMFTIGKSETGEYGDLVTVDITSFGTGDKINLKGAYGDNAGFNIGVLGPLGLGNPVDVSVVDGGIQVLLMNAPAVDNIDTWTVNISGDAITADVIAAVNGAADAAAAIAGVADILGAADWFVY